MPTRRPATETQLRAEAAELRARAYNLPWASTRRERILARARIVEMAADHLPPSLREGEPAPVPAVKPGQ